jgi:hypothetical protein
MIEANRAAQGEAWELGEDGPVKKIMLYQDGQKGVRSSPRFDDLRGRRVRIWSYEHGLYWRPESQGYTAVPGDAGLVEIVAQAIAALEAAGYAVVPVEPTAEMIATGVIECESYDSRYDDVGEAVRRIWRAMLEARPR